MKQVLIFTVTRDHNHPIDLDYVLNVADKEELSSFLVDEVYADRLKLLSIVDDDTVHHCTLPRICCIHCEHRINCLTRK